MVNLDIFNGGGYGAELTAFSGRLGAQRESFHGSIEAASALGWVYVKESTRYNA